MATYRLTRPAQSLIETVEFSSFNEAVAFRAAHPEASKPYRKNPTDRASKWAVSKVNTAASAAVYTKLPHWNKPLMYDFIQNVTMFLPQPERLTAA